MKIFIKTLLFLILTFGTFNGRAQSTNWSVQFADAIIARWPNTINDMTNKQWEYSNGIVLHSIEKAFEKTGDIDYLNYIKDFADDFIDEEGNITYKTDANNLDLIQPSLLCLFLYEQTGEEKYKIAAQNTRKKLDSHPRNVSGGFWHKDNYPNQMWLDGIYMAEPFLVKYGNMFNDTAYTSNEATFQVLLLAQHAYDESVKLLYHGWDETKTASWADASTGVSPEIWSRGMGWYTMAIIDILKYLPETNAGYDEMITLINNIAEGLKNTQDSTTGLWHQVVDKGSNVDNWIETSGSGMFIYGLKHAVDQGYIDTSYMAVVRKAWSGLQDYITLDSYDRPVVSNYVGGMGILDNYASYVGKSTQTCPPSTHPHGYCGFMMAATAMENTPKKMFQTHLNIIGNGNFEFLTGGIISDSGRLVTITAVPDSLNSFTEWTGDINSTNDTISFYITANTSIDIYFVKDTTYSPIVYEAEDGTWNEGGLVETEHTGYSGSGYVNTTNDYGAYINFSVDVSLLKKYSFNLTYANGGTTDRQFDVIVNDTIKYVSVSCPVTTDWTTWEDISFDLILYPGINTIRIYSKTSDGLANIDKLSLVSCTDAQFFTLNVSITGNGSVDYIQKAIYVEGSYLRLLASPDEGNYFKNWSGDISGTNALLDIIMNKDYYITANFETGVLPKYTLTLFKVGSGSVFFDPAGTVYDSGTVVFFSIEPDPGYYTDTIYGDISGSKDDPYILMNDNKMLNVIFTEKVVPQYTITLLQIGSGTVTFNPEGPLYDSNTVVNVIATPAQDYMFNGFSGDLISSANNVNITVDKNLNLNASFILINKLEINEHLSSGLYPNPADKLIHLHTNSKVQVIQIIKPNGAIIKTLNFENEDNIYVININDIEKGMYFINVITNNSTYTKRFIKN